MKQLKLLLGSFILSILAILQTFLINDTATLGVIISLVTLIILLVVKDDVSPKEKRLLLVLSVAYMITMSLWIQVDISGIWLLSQLILITFLAYCSWLAIFGYYKKKIFAKVLGSLFLIIISVAPIVTTYLIFKPDQIGYLLQQSVNTLNSFEPQKGFEVSVADTNRLQSDISYGTEYPNSYLDIITPKTGDTLNRPTYFYVHGGGYVSGDKMQGDPNQVSEYSASVFHFEEMIKMGYNVVSINYALAPDYKYPTPLKQISQAVDFLEEHGHKYGVSMDKVVFAGSSAGGGAIADYIAVQANPNYAKQVGITPSIALNQIKAVVLEVPALDIERVSKTYLQSQFEDYLFGQSLVMYYDQPLVSPNRSYLKSISPLYQITSDFPPVFVTDGNTGSFRNQAEDYYHMLRDAGVTAEIFIPTLENYGKQGHGYLADIKSEATKTYIERKKIFLESLN